MAFLDLSKLQEILVTGGAGFVGSHVVERLLEVCPNANIRILDALAPAADLSNLRPLLESNRVSFFRRDIANPEIVGRLAAGADLIVNLAADTGVDRAFANPVHIHSAAMLGTQILADAMHRHAVPLMLHVSSAAVYGRTAMEPCDETAPFRPLHPLAAAKAASEMILRSQQEAYDLDIRILRPVTIAGTRQGGDRMLPRFIDSALSGQPLTIHGSGAQQRCFLSVSDFTAALVAVISQGARGGVYNVGSTDEHSVLDVADMVHRHASETAVVPVMIRDRPAQDMRRIVSSASLMALGWAPQQSLADILPEIVAWKADHHTDALRRRRFVQAPALSPLLSGAGDTHLQPGNRSRIGR